MIIIGYFAGLLQVQQSFNVKGAIDVDFWIFPSFCCRHYLHACRFGNLQVFTVLFGKVAMG